MLKLCNFVFRGMCRSTFSHDAVRILASPKSIAGGAPNCKTVELWCIFHFFSFLTSIGCFSMQDILILSFSGTVSPSGQSLQTTQPFFPLELHVATHTEFDSCKLERIRAFVQVASLQQFYTPKNMHIMTTMNMHIMTTQWICISCQLLVFVNNGHSFFHDQRPFKTNICYVKYPSQKPCLDSILPSSVSNLRGDHHNPLPAKLVHTRKINLRRLVICWKTRW